MKDVLSPYGTSPAFSKASRYGNFKFTLNLNDLIGFYKTSMGVTEIELRVLGTVTFKWEVMHSILVCPVFEDGKFEGYPMLGDDVISMDLNTMTGDWNWKTKSTGEKIRQLINNAGE